MALTSKPFQQRLPTTAISYLGVSNACPLGRSYLNKKSYECKSVISNT